ncbi:class I adenylate-forming enzyme family protein [Novosphingobium sp. ZN18A2]|uniref:class I adenylate-forming enzyme family protein n=1 Tax=Novosphingobium sp. ZN18A2 TaxID=3079861 RepID=UPI0030D3B0FD
MLVEEIVEADFIPYSEILRAHAARRGDAIALADEDRRVSWAEMDVLLDRVAAALQRDGVVANEPVAMVGANSVPYALTFLGAIRAGAVAAPLTTSANAEALVAMLKDSGSRLLFWDKASAEKLAGHALPDGVKTVAWEDGAPGVPFEQWMEPAGAKPVERVPDPSDPFNIIYSSGTTGTPKGIVQSHQMRYEHIRRTVAGGYGDDAVVINSTPLYSNTTLVSFLPVLAGGGKAVLMPKFDAHKFLQLSERERVTHAMLVPVQYRRIMELPDFDSFDLSSYRLKSCTSAPFPAWLKRDILDRWPGGLMEAYGMTEGGGTCLLLAHEHPDKLHTVGQPQAGHIIKLIDEAGNEVPQGEMGEVVGHSPAMMNGYHGQPGKTRETEWYDKEGRRYIRHGDLARFDEDGFLILMDRSKDMIISGGFNIYPTDLEAELTRQSAVREAAVVGVPSDKWGETPLAIIVLADPSADPDSILAEANSALGKTQRISGIRVVDELPRSQIGKVLKRELRDRFGGNPIANA